VSFIIDTNLVSFEAIRDKLNTFIDSSPDEAKWKGFFNSPVGMKVVELIAALGTYGAFQNITARRETYHQYSLKRSSKIANSQNLGYSVFRGLNERLKFTIVPDFTGIFEKYQIVGSVKDQDLIILEETPVNVGIETDIEITFGKLKEEEITISSEDPGRFRFSIDNISEDIRIFLNNIEVEKSNIILDLINDKFTILTNVYGSIDVFSLNRETANIKYMTNDKIKAVAIELNNLDYETKHLIFDYGTINNIEKLTDYQIPETKEQITINAPLYHETQSLIKAREDYAKVFKLLDTSIVDTNWRSITAAVLELVYVRLKRQVFTSTEIDNLKTLLSNQRTMGLKPPTITYPIRNLLKLKIILKLLTNGNSILDIENIIVDYEKVLEQELDFSTLENLIEALSYVKTARLEIKGDVWESEGVYEKGQFLVPTEGNETDFIYQITKFLRKSGELEPDWDLDSNPGNNNSTTSVNVSVSTIIVGSGIHNEVQKISFDLLPGVGNWKLKFDTETTSSLSYNAPSSEIKTALELLSNISVNDVLVTGNYIDGFSIAFQGNLGNLDVSELEIIDNTLLHYNTPAIGDLFTDSFLQWECIQLPDNYTMDEINEWEPEKHYDIDGLIKPGPLFIGINSNKIFKVKKYYNFSYAVSEIQKIIFDSLPALGKWRIDFDTKITEELDFNAPASEIKLKLEVLENIGIGNIDVSGDYINGFIVKFINELKNRTISPLDFLFSGINEVQKISFDFEPEVGGWKINYDGQITTILSYNTIVSEIQTALEDLNNIGVGNVLVTGNYLDGIAITFQNNLGKREIVPLLVVDSTLINTNAEVSGEVSTTIEGKIDILDQNEIQKIEFSLVPNKGYWSILFDGKVTDLLLFDASIDEIKTALEDLPNINTNDISIIGNYTDGFSVEFKGTLENKPVIELSASYNSLEYDKIIGQIIEPNISTIQKGSNGAKNEIQHLGFTLVPDNGNWKLKFEGETTNTFAYNLPASNIKTELENLSSIGVGNVNVAGNYTNGFIVEFKGILSNFDVSQLVVIDNFLYQGVTKVEIMTGNEVQKANFNISPVSGDWKLRFKGETTTAIPYNASSNNIKTALELLNTIGNGNIFVTGNYDVEKEFYFIFQGDLENIQVPELEVIDNNLSPTTSITISTITQYGSDDTYNEIQKIDFLEVPTEGLWSIIFDDEVTTPIYYNATTVIIQEVLENLSNIGVNDVLVTGSYTNGFSIEFKNALGNKDLPQITITKNSLKYKGGTSQLVNLSVSTTQEGQAAALGNNEIQKITFQTVPDSGTFKIKFDTETTNAIPYDTLVGNIKTELEFFSSIGVGNINVSGDFSTGFSLEFIGSLAKQDIQNEFEIVDNLLFRTNAPVSVEIIEELKGTSSANTLRDAGGDIVNITSETLIDAENPEPVWPTVENELIKDNQILWLSVPINGTPPYWKSNQNYEIGEYVVPSDPEVAEGLMFQCVGFTSKAAKNEPGINGEDEWTEVLDKSLNNGDLELTARDPQSNPTKLDFNEYYEIEQDIEVI